MANATSTQLQELYVAYFGRAADPTGLDYWTEEGVTTAKFAADMYAQAEFKDAYGSKTVEAQVNQIYKNLFDREADVTGLTYWTQQINTGVLKLAEIANHLIYAAKNNAGSEDDKTALSNRTAAAEAYTAEVKSTTAGILAYSAKTTSPFVAGVNFTEAKSYMSGIDKDTAHTAAGVTASVATIVSNGPAADYVAPVAAVVTPTATYSISPSVTSLDEGSTLTTLISTTNVDAGTNLYWSISGTNIDSDDFSAGTLNGIGRVASDGTIPSLSHTIANDVTTEGSETLEIKLFTDAARTTQVGSTASVSIGDTSLTAAAVSQTLALTANIDTLTGGEADDTFNAVNTATSTVLTNLDSLTGGAGTDTLSLSDTANGALVLPTSLTLSGIETVNITHLSDAATDIITADVSGYADVDTLTVTNAGTDINTVTVTTKANVSSLTIDGGAGSDIAAFVHDETTTTATASVANTDVLSTLSLIGLTGTGTVASDSLTSVTVKNAAGVVTNTDDYVVSTDTRTLNVTHNGGTNGGVLDAGATTVDFDVDAATTNAGTNTFAAATTLNVDVNATHTAGTIVVAAATDVNVNLDAAVTAMTITSDAATTIDFTGTANATVTQNGTAAAVITNSGTGNLTLNTAIAAGQTYTGGSGNDTFTQAGTGTKANTAGAGDDTVTFSAVAGSGGSVDGGTGTDTVSLTAALAASLSAATTFEGDIANFERLTIGATANNAGAATIALANLDDINYVTSAGATAETGGSNVVQTISGFSSGGTFKQTALQGTNQSVTLTGSFTGTSDTFNLIASGTNGFANAGALTLAAVETVNITTDDTDTTAATTMVDFNMDVAGATTINVSGDIGITFANGTHANVTTMDASGVTATTTAGVVTFTGTSSSDITITGGAGNDALTGGAANDTISGGVGVDSLSGAGGADTITGGAGVDTITGGTGADTMTGGAGNDIFVIGTTSGSLASGDTEATADKITDYTAGDIIRFEAVNTLAGASSSGTTNATTDVSVSSGGKVTFATADDTLTEKVAALQADGTDLANAEVAFFEHSGSTYIYCAGDATGTATDDFIVKLVGNTGYTTITQDAGGTDGDFTIA